MKAITLNDFELYITCEQVHTLYDNETGAEWVIDTSNVENDGEARYINEKTGEVLLENEIEKYYVVGLDLSPRRFLSAYIAKEVS